MHVPQNMRGLVFLVGRVDDLHELVRLQGRAANEAAVRPHERAHVGTPFGFHILGRNESALRQGLLRKRLDAPDGAARLRSPVDGVRQSS